MSLSSETNKLIGDSKTARLAAVAEIASSVKREREQIRAFLQGSRVILAATLDRQLKGIFSEAAFIRGAAHDLIERFAAERENKAELLRTELVDYTSQLQEDVSKQLNGLAKTRTSKAKRGHVMRQAYLKELRRGIKTALADTDKVISEFNRSRTATEPASGKPQPSRSKPSRSTAKAAPRPAQSATKSEAPSPAPSVMPEHTPAKHAKAKKAKSS